jgi:hypothetical protein
MSDASGPSILLSADGTATLIGADHDKSISVLSGYCSGIRVPLYPAATLSVQTAERILRFSNSWAEGTFGLF